MTAAIPPVPTAAAVPVVEEEAVPPPAMDAYENAAFCVRCC